MSLDAFTTVDILRTKLQAKIVGTLGLALLIEACNSSDYINQASLDLSLRIDSDGDNEQAAKLKKQQQSNNRRN